MALSLSFSHAERVDNKVLTITDTSGIYHAVTNPTGWGAPNTAVGDIDGVAVTLELDITITTSDGTVTVYDTINLVTEFGPFVTVNDLVFAIDCSKLLDGGTALGTANDELPDGVYDITYSCNAITTTNVELIDGRVENAAFKLLRMMNTAYEYDGCIEDTTIVAIFVKTYLDSVRTLDVAARRQSVLEQLNTLERLLINTSVYDI